MPTSVPISHAGFTSVTPAAMNLKTNVLHAGLTGVGGGLVSYALFPEQAFVRPALHIAASAAIVNIIAPYGRPVNRAVMAGAVMGAQCFIFGKNCPVDGALAYAAATAVCFYVGEQVVLPYLMKAEGTIASRV